MAKDWNLTTGTDSYEQWWRSGQQLILCPPGTSPTLDATVTQIRKYADGTVVTSDQAAINLVMSDLTGDDLADAEVIQAALTRIIARHLPSA